MNRIGTLRFPPQGKLMFKRAFAIVLGALAIGSAHPVRGASTLEPGELRMPGDGDHALQVLTPSLLELTFVSAVPEGAAPVDLERAFKAADFKVSAGQTAMNISSVGFKRRVLYAPVKRRDLRVATWIYLRLSEPIADGAPVRVTNAHNPLWPAALEFQGDAKADRFNPAIHVNQEGYAPKFPKRAFVGYYLGSLGEMEIPDRAGFDLIKAGSGKRVFHGDLRLRRDLGFTVLPKPYQRVFEADFSSFDTPGEYRLHIDGLGASLPFRVDEGEPMNFARTYALGLYHQRCGTELALPWTRFVHDACHTAPASVPVPPGKFAKAWEIIRKLENDDVKPEHPEQQLRRPEDQEYPFVRTGTVDVQGGHHDAGDYSKYTTNSAQLIHVLMFAVDNFPGVAELDNLGLPESGDGISDLLQEAKWESDFLARMQDEDGGFYFLVYPRDRRYESGPPNPGDPQIVWPKNTAATAAAVAALAQCASSPVFRKQYPEVADRYLKKALLGWQYLQRAIEQNGRFKAYQRLTHYGDFAADTDELAWAACELFLATGEAKYDERLHEFFPNPSDPVTREWNWHRAVFAYGNTMRSYAFASSSGRLPRNKLDVGYLQKCELELRRAGEDVLKAADQNAYGLSYPEASKRLVTAGWFFASDESFDLAVAYQLQHRAAFLDAILTNLNYEFGCNPVNRALVTGVGQQRQREIVHQYAQGDDRVLPPSGIPLGSLQSQLPFLDLYKAQLRELSWPRDDGPGANYPLYDRWSDAYNLGTEFVIVNQARSLAALAFVAAQSPLKSQAWRSAKASITCNSEGVAIGQPVTFSISAPDVDLSSARIVWEAKDSEPKFGRDLRYTAKRSGRQWVEVEAALPDGRRVFARKEFRVDTAAVIWLDGALPEGATTSSRGGDSWSWLAPGGKPPALRNHGDRRQHESALATGIHDHAFDNVAEAFEIASGDVLFAYIQIDPEHPPKTIMLEWNDGAFDHRAFWGENKIPWGKLGTPTQLHMGPLPPSGRWVRLEVPAKALSLEGHSIKAMAFRLFDGHARWDACGKLSAAAAKDPNFTFPPPVE
jgi:hypothetical protein